MHISYSSKNCAQEKSSDAILSEILYIACPHVAT